MPTKLTKGTIPSGHDLDDFKCFGPVATTDGQFEDTMLTDMGCFTQDGKDSNKWYHGAVVESKKTGEWFAYYEWGRTGKSSVDRQFTKCASKEEAQKVYAKQMHSKNDKRGEWVTLGSRQVLRAKSGKDCYLIRQLATRDHGLPDAKNIANSDAQGTKTTKKKTKKKTTKKASGPKIDKQTAKLLKDMQVATVEYTRSSIQGGMIPTQHAIDEGRDILTEAKKRLVVVGDDIDAQTADDEIVMLSEQIYGRIPKEKRLGAGAHAWILSANNIMQWESDLDAYESALHDVEIEETGESNPLVEMKLNMEWIDPGTELGKFMYEWMPKASRDRHHGIGRIKIKNVWKVEQNGVTDKFMGKIDKIKKPRGKFSEQPLHQPKDKRPDLTTDEKRDFMNANVGMLFHGTRSVNVTGILRENLRLPKTLVGVQITGAMFGGGLYWADDWKKSAGYCSIRNSYWAGGSGAVRGRGAFMFVGDVALGKIHVAPGPRGYTGPPSGHDSVMGKAGHSRVMNNEFITYDTNQHRLRWLVEFDT